MTLRNMLLIFLLIFLLEHFAVSLGLNSKHVLSLETKKGSDLESLSSQDLQYKGNFPPEKNPAYSERLHRRPRRYAKRKPNLLNKWNFRQLQTQYDINPDHSYRSVKDDTNPYDLKMNIDGFQVKVISSPKSRHFSGNQIEKESEQLKTGHVIEIVPNAETETIPENLNGNEETKEESSKGISLDNVILPESSSDGGNVLKTEISKPEIFSEQNKSALNSDLFVNENIIGLKDYEEGSGDGQSLHVNSAEDDFVKDPNLSIANSEKRELNKSSRLIDVFFRSSDSLTTCKTPMGEGGHCKRMTECLLSDALSNFSLFLKYLCLMRGPFVGMCCPDNPVVEINDGDNTTDTTIQEFKQPEEGCGKNSNLRIVGGKISLPHEWTWMVALLRRNRFFCGGVIINNWYILTAAHCVLGLKVKDLTVRLGEYNFSEKNEHQQDIPIAEIKRHAQFVTLTFQHDIALLKLKRKVEYSKFIGSICLPESRDYSEVNATVVGWGTVSFGGAASSILRQVTIPVWSNEECDKTYVFESITESFMCAGSPENGEDACQGDSGGPLMSFNKENRWEVIGIVSWGRRCGDPTYPGVYTRVSTYLDWIQQNINLKKKKKLFQ